MGVAFFGKKAGKIPMPGKAGTAPAFANAGRETTCSATPA